MLLPKARADGYTGKPPITIDWTEGIGQMGLASRQFHRERHFQPERQTMSVRGLQLPESTRVRLVEFQNRVRVVKIAEGILAGLFGLVVSYLAVFLIDRFIDTPALLRSVLLLIGSVGMAVLFPLKCHRWIWGTRRMEQVAILLKHKFPALGDQLLGIVELAHSERDLGQSQRLAEAAILQVDAAVRGRDFSNAVPRPRHRFWAKVVAVPALLVLLALAIVPAAGFNAMARWLMPWRKVDRYTFAQVESLPKQIVVPHGEEFQLGASLSDATRWSPASASAGFSGQPVSKAANQNQAYQFELPAQTNNGTLNVRVGDLTKDVAVNVANRPELSSLSASISLPDYLQYSRPMKADVRGGVISVLKGATAEFEAEISRDLAEASVSDVPAKVEGNRVRPAPVKVTESSVLNFRWRDELGLTPRDAFQLKVNAVDDAAPEITFQQQEPQQVVLSTDTITFDLQSRDDFGVRNVGIEWKGVAHPVQNPAPDVGEKLVEGGAPEKTRLTATATFCAETDNIRAQTLELRSYVEDYNPDRGRIYSPAYVVHVMTPDQHAVWMMSQLRRWASLADDVYEEEMRLHDANRQIRQMDSDQLNAPETRRQIEQQAAAEKSNGQRLTAVTDQGDQLLKQALRNKEMMVGHLETWADGLQRLRSIAENRMPSVADLLAQGAKAPGKKAASANAQAKTKTGPQAGNNKGNQTGEPGEAKKNDQPQPAVPKLTDTESGFNKQNPATGEQKESKPSKGKFGLPTTVLQGGPPQDETKKKPETPAEEKVEEAVKEQTDLLAEFEKVREDLQKIMDDLENSTFVKRFKSASREQIDVATALNRTLFDGFGVKEDSLDQRQKDQSGRIADRESAQSQKVRDIQSDLEAYYDRRKEEKFLRIMQEMEEFQVVKKLGELGDRVRDNRSGESIARAEYWGDTLDRWAEELVSASKCGQCKGCKGDSLPPSIVLEVMRILEGEMDLREETRSLEQLRDNLETVAYTDKAELQAETQRKLYNRAVNVVKDIQALPLGEQKFGKEIQMISAAGGAMNDAIDILSRPDTGREAIAAETEAIELLLQAKRANPKSGGGGGGSNPGGGGTGDTDRVALELYGPGSDPLAQIEARGVQQSTGTTNDQVPAEFRDGIDAFFNALENRK